MARPDWTWRRVYPALSRFEHKPGCYAVYFGDELAYIGQSANLRLRMRRYHIHRTEAGWATPWGMTHILRIKVAYSRKYGDWAMRELRLLRRLAPSFNSILYSGKESPRKVAANA